MTTSTFKLTKPPAGSLAPLVEVEVEDGDTASTLTDRISDCTNRGQTAVIGHDGPEVEIKPHTRRDKILEIVERTVVFE